jgi:hypothetical protein
MTGTENTRFLEAQEKYIETRLNRYLGEMYKECMKVAESYIRKYARACRISICTKELAHESTTYLICRYATDSGFRVKNMPGYLSLCCKHVLFRDKEWDMRKVSFEDWMRATGEADYDGQ